MMVRRTLLLAAVFCASASNAPAFDTKWHAEATRIAMERNGFSADARLLCQFENYLTDFFSGTDAQELVWSRLGVEPPRGQTGLPGMDMTDFARLHFDALTTEAQVEQQWKQLLENTIASLQRWSKDPAVKPAYRPVVLMTVLGASLHAIQDFYSHSNWLRKIGPNATPPTSGPVPIWFDVPRRVRESLEIKSGWYPDGNRFGILYHKQENKDSTGRPLNPEAVEAATRASIDWIRRLMDAAPEVPWAALKAWRAQPANLNGTWLRNADATFVTTTSTIVGHWDGATPAKNVFSPEPPRNSRLAGEALQLTLGVYSRNVAISHNSATPSPHWVGFTVYHVEKALAYGLYLQDFKK